VKVVVNASLIINYDLATSAIIHS